ncbi:MAG: 2-C-methyl-D-erythritol 2,4-cyclodiphosphate synthase [Puniceicoccales bacterium]|jgi:2-C-methyl-D-erythritol 2,4-cyclodiphosphate synthase|nr:2-C-methyl-D-erythritol 2,4-cyclodiphosphate synthase [Puniceicoccales bacterium]
MNIRIGHGYDIHKLIWGRKLILAGVHVESELGLLGHSDADVVLHALSDAILGALALPDIGVYFPDTNPKNKDLDSKKILSFANDKLVEQNFQISNLDITIIAEMPKLSPFIGGMKKSIAEILSIQWTQIGIKTTTNERLGDIGQGKAIAAFANVLLMAG